MGLTDLIRRSLIESESELPPSKPPKNIQSILDQIKLFGQKYKSNVEISSQRDLHYVNEFHFCLSYLHVLLRNPLLVIRSNLNILHFHGPWYLESKIQNPKAHIRNFVKFVLEVILVHSFPRIIRVS